MKVIPCRTQGCGGSYEADVPDSPHDWTPDDWGRVADAQNDHVAAHPESLKVGFDRSRGWGGRALAPRGVRVPPRRRRPRAEEGSP